MDFRVEKLKKVRMFPSPEEKLRAVVERAPEAEAFAERCADRARPFWDAVYGARRRLATLGVILLSGWLFLHVMFGANGMVVYRTKRADFQRLQGEINSLQKENGQYADQIKALRSDPRAIEKEAREQLHYTRPGEYVYVNPAVKAPATRDTSSAKK
jgi:cell division protein FtsB